MKQMEMPDVDGDVAEQGGSESGGKRLRGPGRASC